MSAEHDHEHERTEHTMSRLQPTHTIVGALPQGHPGLWGTPVGPGKETHGTPVNEQGRRGWAHNSFHDTTTTGLRRKCFQETSAYRHL